MPDDFLSDIDARIDAVGARRRRQPRRTWKVEELPPMVAPPGYVRDRAGRWRYEKTGLYVPGARDRTLRRMVAPTTCRCRGHVLFETTATDRAELAWVAGVEEDCTPTVRSLAGEEVAASAVPRIEWQLRCDVSLGVYAPELSVDQLLDPAAAADAARLLPGSLASALSRGRFVPPQAQLGRTPVWAAPIIAQWRAGLW